MPRNTQPKARSKAELLEQLNLALESSQMGLWNWDPATNQVSGDPRWTAMVGLPPAAPGVDLAVWLARIHPDQRAAVQNSLDEIRQGVKPSHEITYRLRDYLGEYQPITERARVTARDSAGQITMLSGTLSPCPTPHNPEETIPLSNPFSRPGSQRSERHSQEIALLNWLVEMLQLCGTTDEAFEVIASTLKRLFQSADGLLAQPNQVSDQLQVVVQWGGVQAKPIFFADDCWALRRKFIHQTNEGSRQLLCKHILEPAPAATICIPMIVQEEIVGLFYLCHQTNPQYFDTTTLQLIQAIADSAAVAMDNINLRETLRQQSIRDPLTHLFNRRYMEETLERELKRADRGGYPLSLILFDIDYFKQVNDLNGHLSGDVVLRDLGHMLLSHTRADDVACRYGGEEFLTILPNTNRPSALAKAEKLRAMIKNMEWHFNIQRPTRITVSLGVAVYPADGKTTQELLQAADAGLYRAKNEGRDRVISLGSDERKEV